MGVCVRRDFVFQNSVVEVGGVDGVDGVEGAEGVCACCER